jgi:hypothetical protein
VFQLTVTVGQAELLRDFDREKQDTLAITADMTRQYKAMQEELLKRLNVLENTIQEQKDQLGMQPLLRNVFCSFFWCGFFLPLTWCFCYLKFRACSTSQRRS